MAAAREAAISGEQATTRGMDAFVMRTMAMPPASLLCALPQPADAVVRTDTARLHRVPEAAREKVVVLGKPIDQAAQKAGEIFGLHFMPQGKRVAIRPVKGYTTKQIAEAMQISLLFPHRDWRAD